MRKIGPSSRHCWTGFTRLAPVGALEEMPVKKMQSACGGKSAPLKCEAGLVRREFVGPRPATVEDLERATGFGQNPNRKQLRIISVCP